MPSPEYTTSDLDLASCLVAEGHALQALARDHRGRTCFTFPDCPELQESRLSFLSGTSEINLAAFGRARRSLLDAVHGSI